MNKRLLILAAFLTLSGCYEEPVKFSEKLDTYVVTGVHPGKYTSVDLKNVKSGQVWLYQSMGYCYYKHDIKVGGLWDIYEVVYRYPESNRFTSKLVGLGAICNK